jgi:hypothetical protein
MQPEISLGKNRTGIKASPLDAGELAEMRGYQLDVGQPTITAAELRASYMGDGETVGSVRPPTTIKGMVGATAQAFTGHRMHVLLDKLGERAAFERAGVRLYDAMLQKAQQLDRLPGDMTIEALQSIRDDEAAHFALVADAIERLGGDSTTQTPCADIAGVQGMGLLQAMTDPRTTLAQALDTLLAAELIDNASWELLIELAGGFGQDALVDDFRTALEHENLHAARVRGWLVAELDAVAKITH